MLCPTIDWTQSSLTMKGIGTYVQGARFCHKTIQVAIVRIWFRIGLWRKYTHALWVILCLFVPKLRARPRVYFVVGENNLCIRSSAYKLPVEITFPASPNQCRRRMMNTTITRL
jgi:hypothetical protein